MLRIGQPQHYLWYKSTASNVCLMEWLPQLRGCSFLEDSFASCLCRMSHATAMKMASVCRAEKRLRCSLKRCQSLHHMLEHSPSPVHGDPARQSACTAARIAMSVVVPICITASAFAAMQCISSTFTALGLYQNSSFFQSILGVIDRIGFTVLRFFRTWLFHAGLEDCTI